MDKFFSVIIPSFNRAQTLSRAIDSVLNQSFKNYELIIIDDGSTDNTQELLRNYPQLEIIRTRNFGVSHARNIGIKNSKGKWIAFLDSDDEWEKEKLQLQYECIENNSEAVLVHGEERWFRNGEFVNQMKKHKKGAGDQFLASLKLCAISPSTACVKREVLEEFNYFREDYPVCEDYDLWLKITAKYPVHFIQVPIIKKYGGHEDQLSRKFKAMDYYRVKSIHFVLQNSILDKEKKDAAISILLGKAKILLNGYRKYDNMDNYSEIESIKNFYIS